MKFAKNWDSMPRQQIQSLQVNRLKGFLTNQVIQFSPYYSKLHQDGKFPIEKIRTLDDLKHLPFTTKADMVPTDENPAKPRDFILQPDPNTVSSKLTFFRKMDLVKGKLLKGKTFKSQILEEYLP
ncbi:MAG: hypothetical protein ABIG42_06375, partial [bacterium]